MKVAFHFNSDHSSLGISYGEKIEKLIFDLLLESRNLNLSSKILVGDLLIVSMAYETNQQLSTFNQDKYCEIVNNWLKPKHTVWSSMINERVMDSVKVGGNIFVVCFETLEERIVEYIDDRLLKISDAYLGGLEGVHLSFAMSKYA